MRSILKILMLLSMVGCMERESSQAKVSLLNISFPHFEKSVFKVLIDGGLVLTDSVDNQFISSYPWKEHTIKVPKDSFKLGVIVNSNGLELRKDTTIAYSDTLNVFVRFNFSPYYKRYRNPDIYRYLPKETSRLKEIADSLYKNNVLKNADEYLKDTIPQKRNIEIYTQ